MNDVIYRTKKCALILIVFQDSGKLDVRFTKLHSTILTTTHNAVHYNQELIMWRGEYLMLYSPVIDNCAEVKWLPFHVT